MPNPFLEYFTAVYDSGIVACHKMRQVANILLNEYDRPERWHFDHKMANKPVDWIERFCKQPSGRLGDPIRLEPFQKAILMAVFGFVDDNGIRRYQEVLEVIARKNGKTTLCSAIELYMLLQDGEGAPQIYNIATKYDQAMLGFNAARKMVVQSPTLSRNVIKRAYDLYAERNMGFVKALSSNTKSLDGLDIHLGVIDELHAIENRDVYDLAKQAMGTRRKPLLFVISTNGYIRDGIFDAQYSYAKDWLDGKVHDDRFVAFIFEMDKREEWKDPVCWIKANPGLGTIKSEEYLRGCVEKGKKDPAFLPTVLTKDFNLIENAATAFFTWEDIVNEQTFSFPGMGFSYAVAGFDLSETTDLTAAVVIMKRRLPDGTVDPNIYMSSMYWIPETVLLESLTSGSRRERDGVPYSQWVRQGLMRTCPGNRINKAVVLDWLDEFQQQTGIYVYYVGYDPWHVESYMEDRLASHYGRRNVFEVRQGYKTESPALKELKAEMQANHLVHNSNPVDLWCMRNTAVKVDVNNNIMLMKKENKGQYRIDGFAALLDAYVVLRDNLEDYEALL
jgi:phage terminase large subunit-like protein